MAVLVSFLVHSHHRLNTSILGSAPPCILVNFWSMEGGCNGVKHTQQDFP
uniref:Uncharacterized protein n=1 Tax=Echinococcus granulosus TaxID=6210 RepID=A0A068WS48_ECHGR|nr:hypothetical protein EgrG_001179700 [Echinococcus granulosus]